MSSHWDDKDCLVIPDASPLPSPASRSSVIKEDPQSKNLITILKKVILLEFFNFCTYIIVTLIVNFYATSVVDRNCAAGELNESMGAAAEARSTLGTVQATAASDGNAAISERDELHKQMIEAATIAARAHAQVTAAIRDVFVSTHTDTSRCEQTAMELIASEIRHGRAAIDHESVKDNLATVAARSTATTEVSKIKEAIANAARTRTQADVAEAKRLVEEFHTRAEGTQAPIAAAERAVDDMAAKGVRFCNAVLKRHDAIGDNARRAHPVADLIRDYVAQVEERESTRKPNVSSSAAAAASSSSSTAASASRVGRRDSDED